MATRFDLGRGVELIRVPSSDTGGAKPRWYITRGNEYVLHRRMGWLHYDSVTDGDFFFTDVDSAFSFFVRTGYGIYEQCWKESDGWDQEGQASEI
jgi:hypothetical protein